MTKARPITIRSAYENPSSTLDEVKDALGGNICRCGCYAEIAQAVLRASARIAKTARIAQTARITDGRSGV